MDNKGIWGFLYKLFPPVLAQQFKAGIIALVILGLFSGFLVALASNDKKRALLGIVLMPIILLGIAILIVFIAYFDYVGRIVQISYNPYTKQLILKRWKKEDISLNIQDCQFSIKHRYARYSSMIYFLVIKVKGKKFVSMPLRCREKDIKAIKDELSLIKQNPQMYKQVKYFDLEKFFQRKT